jgi:hypothetical protein
MAEKNIWAYAAVASPQSAATTIAKLTDDRIASSLLNTKIGIQFASVAVLRSCR